MTCSGVPRCLRLRCLRQIEKYVDFSDAVTVGFPVSVVAVKAEAMGSVLKRYYFPISIQNEKPQVFQQSFLEPGFTLPVQKLLLR